MIEIIILGLSVIASIIGLAMFSKISAKANYDLRLIKFGIFLYLVVLILDFVNQLSIQYPTLKSSLLAIQLSPEYLVLASKFVLIPLFALVLLIGIIKLNQEVQEDSFRVQIERL